MNNINTEKMFLLELGNRCNNNCIFCSAKYREAKDISTYEAKNKILNAKKKGFAKIQFGGGEPTIRNDIVKLVEFAKKQGFAKVGIITNGRMLAYKGFTKKLIESGCNYFALSLHGHNPKIHNVCTRTPGSFEEALKGLKNLLEIKKKSTFVQINFLMSKINAPYLKEFTSWLNNEFEGINMIIIGNISPIGEAAKHPNLIFNIKDFKEDIGESIKSSKAAAIALDFPPCSLGYQHIIHKKNETYSSLSNSGKSMENDIGYMKTKFSFCRNCSFDKECSGIWKEYVKKYGSDGFAPIPARECKK